MTKLQTSLDRLNWIADETHYSFSPDQYSKEDIERMTQESVKLLQNLSRSHSPETLAVLIRYLYAKHFLARDKAYALLNKKDPQAVAHMLQSLLESDELNQLETLTYSLRTFASKVQGELLIGRKLMKKPLVPDNSPLVAAINQTLTARLIELARHPNWFIRANSLCILGYIGLDAPVIKPVLQAGKRDQDGTVREDASYALKVFNQTQKALKESLHQHNDS